MTDFQGKLKEIHEKTSPYAGRVHVFSFNMDGLPDAGETQLRDLGLNWTAMALSFLALSCAL